MTVAALRIGLPWLLRDGCPRCCRRPEAPGVSPGAGPTLRWRSATSLRYTALHARLARRSGRSGDWPSRPSAIHPG